MSALYWFFALVGLWVLVIAFLASNGLLGFLGAFTLAGAVYFLIEEGRP